MKKHKRITINTHIDSALEAYHAQLVSGDFFPVYYGIEVTRHCNYACIMCPHAQFSNEEKGHMDNELFKKIIDDISPYAEIIKMHWVGEPLLHPEIIQLIEYARRNTSAQLYLSTNASLLEGRRAEDIRRSGLSKLIISLDGMSANSYESIRKNGDYYKILKNVESFVRAVEKKGGPLCHITFNRFKLNEHEVELFRKKWSRYRNVMVDVMWLSNWAGNVPGIRKLTNYHNPCCKKKREPCSDLWFKMQIDWSGKVALCCFDAKVTVEIGDVNKNTIGEIWHSPAVQAVRKNHITDNTTGICSKCLDWAVPSEYEFWYTTDELIEDPQQIWHK